MPNLIYLGNYASVDTTECNWTAESEGSLVGISKNYSQLSIVSANVSDGGDGVMQDDDYGTYDYAQYYINGSYRCTKTDTTLSAKVTLTLTDGTTRVVEVVMMQQQNGDLFISDLLNGGTLDNLSIANVRVDEITGDNYSGWYSNQSVDNTSFGPVVARDGYVDGTGGNDVINGSYVDANGDRIDANDQILPGEGVNDDIVRAGAGNDLVLAGNGNDEVYGGTGNYTLCGQDGNDTLFGEDGNDILEGMSGNDLMYGGAGADVVYGDAGNDTMNGDAGNDTIDGGTGNDVLNGGAGDDSILGGDGNDVIMGDDDGGTPVGREDNLTLQWNQVASNGTELGASQTYSVGGMNVNVGFQAQDYGAIGCIETTPIYVEAGEPFSPNSGLYLYGAAVRAVWTIHPRRH